MFFDQKGIYDGNKNVLGRYLTLCLKPDAVWMLMTATSIKQSVFKTGQAHIYSLIKRSMDKWTAISVIARCKCRHL